MVYAFSLEQVPRSETGGISNLGTKANLLSQTTSNCCNNLNIGQNSQNGQNGPS